MPTDSFAYDRYRVRRKVFTIFGASFHIRAPDESLIGFSRQKAFRLKEDIRVFSDEAMKSPLLVVQARQIVDFSAAYDVVDARTGAKVGAARRKGWKSLLRDSWELMDARDAVVGKVLEDSGGMALLRRLLANWVPQTFHVSDAQGRVQAELRQRFNPFVYKLDVTVEPAASMDRRLLLGAAILIAAIEGRQE